MKRATWVFIALLLAAGAGELCFAEENIVCPSKARLASGSVATEDVPPGYKTFVSNTTVGVSGVTVFDGPPEDGAALKPSASSSNGETITWRFEGSYEKGKWVSCDYANGLIRLVRQIGEPTTSCTATVKKTGPYKRIEAKFTCK
jgi:hypothetical protein